MLHIVRIPLNHRVAPQGLLLRRLYSSVDSYHATVI